MNAPRTWIPTFENEQFARMILIERHDQTFVMKLKGKAIIGNAEYSYSTLIANNNETGADALCSDSG